MPKVSVVIPTHNRPEMLKKAIESVLAQTYQDFEIIVVDDGLEQRAESVTRAFNNSCVKYIQHNKERGGGVARNTGIKNSTSEFIAFLDDDDEWLPEKLEFQMDRFNKTSQEIGFCFSAVTNMYDDHRENTSVPDGIADYHELALGNFKGFLTVTLIIKKCVFDDIGLFDEALPSHQEVDLVIRISKKYKGLAINIPLVLVNMRSNHERIGSSLQRRIHGREVVLKKHMLDFRRYPDILAHHSFWLGIMYRDNGSMGTARGHFHKAFLTNRSPRYLLHYLSMLFDALPYKLLYK